MTTLYELTDEFQQALQELAGMQARGEIDDETAADTLEGLGMEVEDKIRNVGLHIKNLRSDLSQLEQAKDQFDARIKAAEDAVAWYEKYLYTNIVKTKCKPISDGQISIRLKPMPDLAQVDKEAPINFCKLKPATPASRSPDKAKILKALKAGEKLDFATLITDRTKLEIK